MNQCCWRTIENTSPYVYFPNQVVFLVLTFLITPVHEQYLLKYTNLTPEKKLFLFFKLFNVGHKSFFRDTGTCGWDL